MGEFAESIVDRLRRCGCTSKEASIYLDCRKNGSCSIQEIADRVKLNRVTVHSAVERLLDKGLLSETREGRRRKLVAEDPEQMLPRVLQEEQRLQLLKSDISGLSHILQALPREDGGKAPQVRLFRGAQGLKRLLEETLEAEGLVRVFIDIEQFLKLLGPSYLRNYYERRAKLGIRSRLIWPECPFSREILTNQSSLKMEIRIDPSFSGSKVGFFSWNDKVGIKCLVEDTLTVTIIQSREIASFYQQIMFDRIWESLAKTRSR